VGVWGLPPQRGRTSSALNGSSHYRVLPVPIMEFRIAVKNQSKHPGINR